MLHGDARGAEPLLEEALGLFHDNGTAGAGMVPIVLGMLGYTLLLQEEHIRAAAHFADAIRMLHEQGNTVMLPYPMYGAAGVWAAQREARRGAELVGVADGLTEASALRPAPGEQAIWEGIRAALRTQLDDAAWMAAWAAGRAMTLEEALAYALAPDPMPPDVLGRRATAGAADEAATLLAAAGGAGSVSLTGREIEILRLVTEGLSYQAIGERLGISRHTVNAHLRRIYGKLGVTSRSAATRRAVVEQLV